MKATEIIDYFNDCYAAVLEKQGNFDALDDVFFDTPYFDADEYQCEWQWIFRNIRERRIVTAVLSVAYNPPTLTLENSKHGSCLDLPIDIIDKIDVSHEATNIEVTIKHEKAYASINIEI